MTGLSYFTCTLGEAALIEGGRPFSTVNQLLDRQAKHHGNLPAVGFYLPYSDKNLDPDTSADSPLTCKVVSFNELLHGTLAVAELLASSFNLSGRQTVALLSASSPEFLFVWLALIRLGHSVLLIAPQLPPSLVAQLCKSCQVSVLFHDHGRVNLAQQAAQSMSDVGGNKLTTHEFPMEGKTSLFEIITRGSGGKLTYPELDENDIAYLHHTSGTSTGTPKPIPQSHHGAVAVLPSLWGSEDSTFTTTPLYHGGVADVFRAWSSCALIWLFPGQDLPITATNITRCLVASDQESTANGRPRVSYFSSVPYVLQMTLQSEQALSFLRRMKMVGVGGASLSQEIGDKLVGDDVNLVSRFGSAECGFIMASHRDYGEDLAWQYLRLNEQVGCIRMEEREEGLSELVVLSNWPHMAKQNRDDGSYATADLFELHPSIKNAWRYHSRADSQLTLITGKKFDPAPVEDALVAATPLLSNVLIFGEGRPFPGCLAFRSEQATSMEDQRFLSALSTTVKKVNSQGQAHTRISLDMVVPMPFIENALPKSSKGTIVRNRAVERYTDQIVGAYAALSSGPKQNITDDEVPDAVFEIVESVVGAKSGSGTALETDADLFSFGVDSIASMQIRQRLVHLLPNGSLPLPLTVVEDQGTILGLTNLVTSLRRGQTPEPKVKPQRQIQDLVRKYSVFTDGHPVLNDATPRRQIHEAHSGVTVVLTGPTGSLGSHVLHQMLGNRQISRIYLLVRGATLHASKERVLKALSSRGLTIPSTFNETVKIVSCKLSEPDLGLSKAQYQEIIEGVDVIMHLAWSVNFLLSLRSFSQHLEGVRNLLNLGLNARKLKGDHQSPRFLFCSSVASVSACQNVVPESVVTDPYACGTTGYGASKLVAELVCREAAEKTAMRNMITILRVGQLSGSSQTGVWNKNEAYPLMLSTQKFTQGILPDLGDEEKLSWLPVDIAATAFLEAADLAEGLDLRDVIKSGMDNSKEGVQVLHLLNPNRSRTFTDLLHDVWQTGGEARGNRQRRKVVPADEWLASIDAAMAGDDPNQKNHPAFRLLGFWQENYGGRKPASQVAVFPSAKGRRGHLLFRDDHRIEGAEDVTWRYQMDRSSQIMPSLQQWTRPLKNEYLSKLLEWVEGNVG